MELLLTLFQMTNFRLFQTETTQTTILNLRKMVENGGKFSKEEKKYCGERRNCFLQAISPFQTVFSIDLYYRHVKTMACLGKG